MDLISIRILDLHAMVTWTTVIIYMNHTQFGPVKVKLIRAPLK